MKRTLDTDENNQIQEPPAKKQKMNDKPIEASKIFTNYKHAEYDQRDFQHMFKSIENSYVVNILPREIRKEIAEYATGDWSECIHCDQGIGILRSALLARKYEGICVDANVSERCWLICMKCAENLDPNNCECGATIYLPNSQRCSVCYESLKICEEQMDDAGHCMESDFAYSYCESCKEYLCSVCTKGITCHGWETCFQHHEYFMGQPNESDAHFKLKCDDCNIDIKCGCFSFEWGKEWNTHNKRIAGSYHGFVACEFADCLNFVCKYHELIRCPQCKTEFNLCSSHTSITWKCEKCNVNSYE